MVIQNTIDNLKERPREDKVALATTIAIGVVVVLLAAWALAFFRSVSENTASLQNAPPSTDASGGAQVQAVQPFSSSTPDTSIMPAQAPAVAPASVPAY